MEKELDKLQNIIGYQFHNTSLLRQSLIHPSYSGEMKMQRFESNQRLEFLGDAVLQYLMSDRLYRNHPSDREGSLTHMRALLVCEAALSPIAQRLGIGEALVMDRGEEMTGGRTKPSVLCDAMEAVLAAVCLDGGMDAARAVMERCWPSESEVSRPMQDSKGRLQEILQQNGGETPSYRITGTSGPPHAPVFEAAVFRGDREIGRGTGKTKKQAEQAAAMAALNGLEKKDETETNSDKR